MKIRVKSFQVRVKPGFSLENVWWHVYDLSFESLAEEIDGLMMDTVYSKLLE